MWHAPPPNLSLTNDDVHVWRAELDLPQERVQYYASLLSADEQSRAERFYLEQHQIRFIVARGTLRTLLGRYLDISPAQLNFEYSSRGKPRLAHSCGGSEVQFNVSHSQGLALFGVTYQRAIGIDLEFLRLLPDAEKIAQRFFSIREYTVISILPPEEQQKAFFKAWTSKEAYLKAMGEGLAGSLDRVEVSLVPNQPARLLSLDGDSFAASRWCLYELAPAYNFIGAVAVEGVIGTPPLQGRASSNPLNLRLSCWCQRDSL